MPYPSFSTHFICFWCIIMPDQKLTRKSTTCIQGLCSVQGIERCDSHHPCSTRVGDTGFCAPILTTMSLCKAPCNAIESSCWGQQMRSIPDTRGRAEPIRLDQCLTPGDSPNDTNKDHLDPKSPRAACSIQRARESELVILGRYMLTNPHIVFVVIAFVFSALPESPQMANGSKLLQSMRARMSC